VQPGLKEKSFSFLRDPEFTMTGVNLCVFCSMTQQQITQQTVPRHLEGINYLPDAEFLFHEKKNPQSQHNITFSIPPFRLSSGMRILRYRKSYSETKPTYIKSH
jgi:hypothetical protein